MKSGWKKADSYWSVATLQPGFSDGNLKFVDTKWFDTKRDRVFRAQELCGSRGGRPGLPVPNKPDGFCGRKATLKQDNETKQLTCNSSRLLL